MSYISAIRDRDEVRVFERNNGVREVVTYPAPYYFFTAHKDGEYESIFGQKLMRHDFKSYREMSSAKQECDSNNTQMFESDISPELKILSEHYYNKPAPILNITMLDIEVDYKPELGFSNVGTEPDQIPYAPINSVSLYHTWENKMIAYAVPPTDETPDMETFLQEMNAIAPLPADVDVEIIFCKNEAMLLQCFLAEIEDSDMLCGWNSDAFDLPYIAKRIYSTLGERYFKQLHFPLASRPYSRSWRKFTNKFMMEQLSLELRGRTLTDYMELFKKYEVAERPSYKLETIAEEVLPEMLKLEYEGSLANLYVDNFAHFVRYNLRDTEILKGFEDRLGYIELANQMYHISTGDARHVLGTLKLAELAINNFCIHELGLRVPNNNIDDESHGIQGAMVLEPNVGMHEWIGSMDINSLYPSAIRSINISPETLIGQFKECERATEEIKKESFVTLTLLLDDGSEREMTADEWKIHLVKRKWAISGFGTVFSQNKQGVIPSVLETWTATRKKYQKLARETTNKEKSAYYDRLQYVYKIKLNSLYGALNNRFFRYYDLRMGESTTGTGRMILRHMCSMVGKLLDDQYDLHAPSVIYGDTDSVYFETHAQNKEDAILIADSVSKKTNETFDDFMRDTFLCTEGFDTIIKAGREVVADRGIFVDKKRYVLHVVDNEGVATDKLKVMGLDTKKTTLPPEVSKCLNRFVERLLKGEDWDVIATDIVQYKEDLMNTNELMSIGLPKGVKRVEYYTEQDKIYGTGARLPGHVAASIFYNQCLETYNDKDSLPITSGMKIKVFYLTQTYGRFKSIAIPTDAQHVPEWFSEHFEVNKDMHLERLVDKPLNNIIKAIGKETPSKQSLMVDELLDF